ncbi:MAG: aminotransferase class IV [Geminocystis sp.]|nr:aminotransferase class IV [Geminocystis sp.]HIK37866.1 aminotransferase class IV [Geminocystis sp. M7585_C2015_104]MCS7146966.1 aminotransferase class IV [Geminocystis sp.]MCX8077278.1 aminotransferase class IV [Geminocystis sp.]MDW8115790.1 aminotransferase class IV [Geminocystis sp.]
MFYFDGNLHRDNKISLDINSPVWLYGVSVFTTIRIYGHSLSHPLTNWNRHVRRLKTSISEFEWPMPDWEKIKTEVEDLSKHFPVIRIAILPDGKEIITGRNLPENLGEKQRQGVRGLVLYDDVVKRGISRHKTGNYLPNWLALNMAKKQDCQEAILTDKQHHWLETATGNLWGYKKGVWFTPPPGEILPGIARETIIDYADFPIEVNQWTEEFVEELEAVAYSNSVVEIIPFSEIQMRDKIKKYNPLHPAYSLLRGVYSKLA